VKILQGASLGRGGQEWPKEAKRLCNSKSSSHTIAVVGRTGAGKSTAMNAVFRNHLLASSNEVRCSLSSHVTLSVP
jgi:ABC-type multidrug transport system fused ATPase/permease subunit